MKLCGILGVIDILIPAANEQFQGVDHSFPTSWLHVENTFPSGTGNTNDMT